MTTAALKKLVTTQVSELSKTINDLEKRAIKVINEGKKTQTYKDVSKKVHSLSLHLQKDPRVQRLLKLQKETWKKNFLSEYLPVRQKDLKALERKVENLGKKIDGLEKK